MYKFSFYASCLRPPTGSLLLLAVLLGLAFGCLRFLGLWFVIVVGSDLVVGVVLKVRRIVGLG